jgi:hypothetical protein
MYSAYTIYKGPAINLEKDPLPRSWILARIAGFDGPRNNGYVILYSRVIGTKHSITISISELPEGIVLRKRWVVMIGDLEWWRDKIRAFDIMNVWFGRNSSEGYHRSNN